MKESRQMVNFRYKRSLPSGKKVTDMTIFVIKSHNLVKKSDQHDNFFYKKSQLVKKVTNMTISVIKSHNLMKKVTNMTIFVIKSHYLVNKLI